VMSKFLPLANFLPPTCKFSPTDFSRNKAVLVLQWLGDADMLHKVHKGFSCSDQTSMILVHGSEYDDQFERA
jgi:hypothetical protein